MMQPNKPDFSGRYSKIAQHFLEQHPAAVRLFHDLITFAPPSLMMFGNIKACPLCALAFDVW